MGKRGADELRMNELDVVSGGFYVVLLAPRPTGRGEAWLPERILTMSPCLTQFFPDAWAIEWVAQSNAERLASAAKFGLNESVLADVVRSMTAALNEGEIGFPNVWRSIVAARATARQFLQRRDDLLLVELGIPTEFAAHLIDDLRPGPGLGSTGLYDCLVAKLPIHEGGVPLGWELLGAELGPSFHSWLCNALHDEAATRLHITPGSLGLLRTEADARAVAALVEEGIGAEPVPWFPALLVGHTLDDTPR
jgi:hypothetical protein